MAFKVHTASQFHKSCKKLLENQAMRFVKTEGANRAIQFGKKMWYLTNSAKPNEHTLLVMTEALGCGQIVILNLG